MATQLSPLPDSPGSLVETAAPRVTLRNYFARSFDSAIAAARTCYSTHLVNPDEVTEKQRVMIGSGTFFGGHHTVYQHAHFEFGLENVSRQFVWSFLHAHPFYNSEQQSQRYVRLDRAQAYVPPADTPNFGPAERAIYEKAIARAWDHYRELTALLAPNAREILADIWHISPMSHAKRVQKVERQSEKRAIEVARYVLPVAAFTTMVHTVSGIVLYRLWRMQAANDTPSESRQIIGEMVARPIRNSSIASTTSRWRSCRSGSRRATGKPLRGSSTRAWAGLRHASSIIRRTRWRRWRKPTAPCWD
jgi:thymidylate synthase ThyX